MIAMTNKHECEEKEKLMRLLKILNKTKSTNMENCDTVIAITIVIIKFVMTK